MTPQPTPARAAKVAPPRRHRFLKGLLAVILLIIAFFMWFDWNWLRVPVQNYVSKKTQREFRISHLDVKLGRYPKVILDNVYFQNADWSKNGPMAQVGKLEFTVSPRDLLERKIILPRLALSNADVVMEELKDGRRNWIFSDPNDKSETVFRISTLSVDHGKLRYINHGQQFDLHIDANTFDPDSPDVTKADAAAANRKLTTRYAFGGRYRDATFKGNAYTGDVLSFQKSEIPFPISGQVLAGTTKLEVDGVVADVVKITSIDTKLRITGQTMANLYPFLLLPLPASPPYDVSGRLKLEGNKYTMDDLKGKIGSTDQFAGIAKQYSEDVASRDNGGQLGTTNRGNDVAKYGQGFDDAIFGLKEAQVSDPIRSNFGWHIVLVTKRQGVVDESLDEYTSQLRAQAHIHSFLK